MVLLQITSYYALRGGRSSNGAPCGAFFVDGGTTFSIPYWGHGAALSFRLSTHYTMHGGHSGVGVDCGAFCIFVNAVVIMTAWAIGAALS